MNTTLLTALALGGAALSVKKPTQNHNLMRLPSFRGIAEVRASLPGRLLLHSFSACLAPLCRAYSFSVSSPIQYH